MRHFARMRGDKNVRMRNLKIQLLVLFTLNLSLALLPAFVPVAKPLIDNAYSSLRPEDVSPISAIRQSGGLMDPFARLGPDASSVVITSSTPRTLAGFEGLNESAANILGCPMLLPACVPPDVQTASDPNHVVETVNDAVRIFSKQGSAITTFALSSFFNSGPVLIVDPRVMFDASSGRWFLTVQEEASGTCQLSIASPPSPQPGRVDLAVSTTSDPTGTWTKYEKTLVNTCGASFRTGNNNIACADQPSIGVSDDKFVITANDYATPCNCGGCFVGAEYWIIKKSDLLAGVSAPNLNESGPFSTQFSVHPVQSLSSTNTQYMVTVGANSTSGLCLDCNPQLISLTGVPPGNVTVQTTPVNISPVSAPLGGVQPGTNLLVATIDSRVQTASWFQGKLWFAMNDGCTPSGDTQPRSCIRLVQIDTTMSPPRVLQNFDFGSRGQYYFYPALAIDSNSDLELVYGFSNSTIYPSLAVTGQLSSDPVGSLGQPLTIKSGSANDTSGRYGDYFGAGVDAFDPGTIWVAGEYHTTTTGSCGSTGSCWSTFIASITLLPPDFSIIPSPWGCNVSRGNPCQVTFTLTSLRGFSGRVSLSVTDLPSGFSASFSHNSVSLSSGGTATSILTVSTNASCTSARPTVVASSGNISHYDSGFVTVPCSPGT